MLKIGDRSSTGVHYYEIRNTRNKWFPRHISNMKLKITLRKSHNDHLNDLKNFKLIC